MHKRTLIASVLGGLLLSSCTAKYQDLLRDRDAQIRELNGDVADLRAANADLERRESTARARAEQLRKNVDARPASVSKGRTTLDRVKEDLPDLDVRYDRGRLSIGIESTVTFASGSSKLKASAGKVLRRVASVIKRDFATRRIYVEGHTDIDPIRRTKGRYRSNRHLSAERADAVADYLVGRGVPARQVAVVGYGEHSPRVKGTAKSAKARNRRVEIVVGDML